MIKPENSNSNAALYVSDYFKKQGDNSYAGDHLIIDFWGAKSLDDIKKMESAFREAIKVSGATLLHMHLHHFTPTRGISGVAVLAESHISVHTWPEKGYAAFDVFMCGSAEPNKAIPVFEKTFAPKKIKITSLKRGQSSSDILSEENS